MEPCSVNRPLELLQKAECSIISDDRKWVRKFFEKLRVFKRKQVLNVKPYTGPHRVIHQFQSSSSYRDCKTSFC